MAHIIQLFGNDVDVTQWMDKHPGGSKLLKIFKDRDATQQFTAIHKGGQAKAILSSLPQKPSKSISEYSEAEREFDEIIKKLEPELSKVSYPYEISKIVYTICMFICGYLICYQPDMKYVGLAMMCLGIYQAGWIGHDYSHRSILEKPSHNNHISDFLGFIVQGYTDIWWKSRHNTHHMTTNEINNDPDVRTEPVFHFYDKTLGKNGSNHIPMQNIFFIILLSILDAFWRYESIMILLKPSNKNHVFKNALGLCVHYSMLLSLLIWTEVTLLDLVMLSLCKGFMTASVVFANHYPEDRLPSDHKMGLFEQTLRTSRNTTGLFFAHHMYDIDVVDNKNTVRLKRSIGGTIRRYIRLFFNETVGYLSMQIEHHLVPTWPSGNLMLLRPYIKELARKHNLPYKETSIVYALYENIIKLNNVGLEQLKHVQ